MDLQPFLLDEWLAAHEFASPPIRYNLGSSTGPVWTFADLMSLGDGDTRQELQTLRISYLPPAGTPGLRQRIAAFHDVDPDWVLATMGASEGLITLFCSVAGPGANVVLPFPVFPAMPVVARAWGLGIKTYHMSRESGFEQSVASILAAVDKNTKLVLVNSPHNPTGSVMPREEVARLAGELGARRIPLVVDEVYHPLYFGRTMESAASLPNTIVLGDMSKALSLPGLRTGWLIDRDAQRRKRLLDARSYFSISGSPVLDLLAATALRSRVKILTRLESVARANLALLDEFMQTHRDTLSWVRPAGGTVSFPWFRDGRNARPVCEALAQAGVLLAPGDTFDAPSHFRLGFGLQENGFLEALAIFSRVLASQ